MMFKWIASMRAPSSERVTIPSLFSSVSSHAISSSRSRALCSLLTADGRKCMCVARVLAWLRATAFDVRNCTGFRFNFDWVCFATTRTTAFAGMAVCMRLICDTHTVICGRGNARHGLQWGTTHHMALCGDRDDATTVPITLSKCRRGSYVMNELLEEDSTFVWSAKISCYMAEFTTEMPCTFS